MERCFSSDRCKDGFPLFTFDAASLQQLSSRSPSMIGMDGAEQSIASRFWP